MKIKSSLIMFTLLLSLPLALMAMEKPAEKTERGNRLEQEIVDLQNHIEFLEEQGATSNESLCKLREELEYKYSIKEQYTKYYESLDL